MIPVSQGKPYAGNLHVRFEEGASASANAEAEGSTPRKCQVDYEGRFTFSVLNFTFEWRSLVCGGRFVRGRSARVAAGEEVFSDFAVHRIRVEQVRRGGSSGKFDFNSERLKCGQPEEAGGVRRHK